MRHVTAVHSLLPNSGASLHSYLMLITAPKSTVSVVLSFPYEIYCVYFMSITSHFSFLMFLRLSLHRIPQWHDPSMKSIHSPSYVNYRPFLLGKPSCLWLKMLESFGSSRASPQAEAFRISSAERWLDCDNNVGWNNRTLPLRLTSRTQSAVEVKIVNPLICRSQVPQA